MENSRQELVGIEKRLDQLNQDFKAMDKKVQEAVKRVYNSFGKIYNRISNEYFLIIICFSILQQKAAQEEVEKWRIQEKDNQEKLDNDAKDLSKVSQKQSLLRQKVEECTNKISELGAIPNPEMISKYMAYTQKNVRNFYAEKYEKYLRIIYNVIVFYVAAFQRIRKSQQSFEEIQSRE